MTLLNFGPSQVASSGTSVQVIKSPESPAAQQVFFTIIGAGDTFSLFCLIVSSFQYNAVGSDSSNTLLFLYSNKINNK